MVGPTSLLVGVTHSHSIRLFLLLSLLLSVFHKIHLVGGTTQFVATACALTEYTAAAALCEAQNMRIPVPKTEAEKATAMATYSAICPTSYFPPIAGPIGAYLYTFWIAARCDLNNNPIWIDDSLAVSGATCVQPNYYIYCSSGDGSFAGYYGGNVFSPTASVLCERLPCPAVGSATACRTATTAVTYTYHQPDCCSCRASAVGPQCQCAIGTSYECDPIGTNTVAYVESTDSCKCNCFLTHGGTRCEKLYCTVAANCNSSATSVTGFVPSCNCTCFINYIGAQCQTRICHVGFDCRGKGLSIISGTYPDCLCRCQKDFGGRNCRTLSQTLSITISTSESHPTLSILETGSETISFTPNRDSPTNSPTYTVLATQSLSVTAATRSLSPSYTKTTTASLSASSSRSQGSLSRSGSMSATPTAPSPSRTPSMTTSNTASPSATLTCRDLDDLNVNDTCSVLRPLPADWAPPLNTSLSIDYRVSSSWLLGEGDCTQIAIPFSVWTGRQGAKHTIGIVSIDQRVPLKATLGPPSMGGGGAPMFEAARTDMQLLPLEIIFTSAEEVANATVRGALPSPPNGPIAPNQTSIGVRGNYFTAIAAIRYTGRPTLNKLQYTMGCSDWARCPIAMSAQMEVTLLASERLFPEAFAETINVGSAIASVFGALTVSPTTVAQLGVVTSLRVMSRCVEISLDDEDDDSGYSDYASGTLNPLQARVGNGGGEGRQFLRASLATSAVYFVALSGLMLFYTTMTARLHGWLGTRGASLVTLPPILQGYPSALIAVASFVMDGAVGAGTLLGVHGNSWADFFIGWLAVACSLGYVAHIAFTTTTKGFPASLVSMELGSVQEKQTTDRRAEAELHESKSSILGISRTNSIDSVLDVLARHSLNDSDLDSILGFHNKRPSFWLRNLKFVNSWLRRPTHEWVPEGEGSSEANRWLLRYASYIADARIAWYCGLEQWVAVLICVLGSLSFSAMPYCITRGVLSVLLIGLQAIVMVVLRPPVQRWRWLLMSVVLILQTITAALSVANAPLQEQSIELAMDSLGAMIFILLSFATATDMVMLLLELKESVEAAMAALRKKKKRTGLPCGELTTPTMHELAAELLPLETRRTPISNNTHEPITNNNTSNTNESDIVEEIISQLLEYEASIAS